MITVDPIRAMLQQVILADISLDHFDEWLSKESWNMHHESSPEAISLVGKIELILADYDAGLQSEDHAIASFRALNGSISKDGLTSTSIADCSQIQSEEQIPALVR